MLEFWQYPDHFLLVKWQRSADRCYSFLADHMTQEEIIEHAQKCFGKSVIEFSVSSLSEESWGLMEETFRKLGAAYFLE